MNDTTPPPPDRGWRQLYRLEDWWACWVGFLILGVAVIGFLGKAPKVGGWVENPLDAFSKQAATTPLELEAAESEELAAALKSRGNTVGKWVSYSAEKSTLTLKKHITESNWQMVRDTSAIPGYLQAVERLQGMPMQTTGSLWLPLLLLMLGLGAAMAVAAKFLHFQPASFFSGYVVVFVLSAIAFAIAGQVRIHAWGLGYALWALVLGLLVSNTVGTPKWLLAGARTELYIKTGLVLLGAEILFSKILRLGGPGLVVAWIVTPTVIVFMWLFGTRLLKMASKPLVIIIAAATSVCGVSAAIATAAACRAKKEDLTLAVGMTLIFTVLMMVLMPMGIRALGMDTDVGAAWIGGTIDSTGAVVAAGAFLGERAEQIAAVVKMIQNILIGLVAFVVAIFWVTRVDRAPGAPKPSGMEIWYRFPKFVIGFVAASVVFSFVVVPLAGSGAADAFEAGVSWVSKEVIGAFTKPVRYWLFCLAFVSIGLESNFREMAERMAGGKPIWLYVVGQSFNLVLTVFAAWLAFGGILFPRV
jgi:uncharacterized integral membrane protein (TIGR00698 family)